MRVSGLRLRRCDGLDGAPHAKEFFGARPLFFTEMQSTVELQVLVVQIVKSL